MDIFNNPKLINKSFAFIDDLLIRVEYEWQKTPNNNGLIKIEVYFLSSWK